MASLFNFGFFGNQPHRVFNYKPRYYDPEEEKRRQMFGDVDGTNEKARENGEYVPGSSLRGAFRNGNYQKTRSSMSTAHSIITIGNFDSESKAADYISSMFIGDYVFGGIDKSKYTAIPISTKNYPIFYQAKDLEEYKTFINESKQ